VLRTQLSKSSGYPALDEAAIAVAKQMQFSPALNRDKKVQVWVEIPIVFTANSKRIGARDPSVERGTGRGRSPFFFAVRLIFAPRESYNFAHVRERLREACRGSRSGSNVRCAVRPGLAVRIVAVTKGHPAAAVRRRGGRV
jgi:hypothetical protein